jgi:hypothetical protein
VYRAQAHAGQAAANESTDIFGGRMGCGASDDLEHRVARTGEAEAPIAQVSFSAYHARLAGVLPTSSFRKDSHCRLAEQVHATEDVPPLSRQRRQEWSHRPRGPRAELAFAPSAHDGELDDRSLSKTRFYAAVKRLLDDVPKSAGT